MKVRWTLRVSASSSAEGSTTSGQRLDPRHQIGLLGDVVAEPDPLGPLDEDADRAIRDLEHPGDDPGHAHVVELRPGPGSSSSGSREATRASIRSPDRTSLTSRIERSWPTASGVSVSG